MVSLVEAEQCGEDGRKENGVEPRWILLSLRLFSNTLLFSLSRSLRLKKKSELRSWFCVEVVFVGRDDTRAVPPDCGNQQRKHRYKRMLTTVFYSKIYLLRTPPPPKLGHLDN